MASSYIVFFSTGHTIIKAWNYMEPIIYSQKASLSDRKASLEMYHRVFSTDVTTP